MADCPSLPPEVILKITKFATMATLASLCAANRGFYALLLPTLYRRGVDIVSKEDSLHLNLAVELIEGNKYSSMAKLLQHGLSASAQRLQDSEHSDLGLLGEDISLLHASAYYEKRTAKNSITKLLLDNGAEVDHKDSFGCTFLHVTLYRGWDSENFQDQEAQIITLVEHGANVNASDKDGWQPMNLAAAFNNWPAVGVLVRHGTNINATDNEGRTPIMRAIENNIDDSHVEVMAELYKYGAQAPSPSDG